MQVINQLIAARLAARKRKRMTLLFMFVVMCGGVLASGGALA
jgi:hypothetical protein